MNTLIYISSKKIARLPIIESGLVPLTMIPFVRVKAYIADRARPSKNCKHGLWHYQLIWSYHTCHAFSLPLRTGTVRTCLYACAFTQGILYVIHVNNFRLCRVMYILRHRQKSLQILFYFCQFKWCTDLLLLMLA